MKSCSEVSAEIIEQLKKDGREVVRPRCIEERPDEEPIAYAIKDGMLYCGDPYLEKDGTYSLCRDMFAYWFTGFKYEELGLIDAHAWYEREKVYQELMCKARLKGTGNAALQRELDARQRRIEELEKQVCELNDRLAHVKQVVNKE